MYIQKSTRENYRKNVNIILWVVLTWTTKIAVHIALKAPPQCEPWNTTIYTKLSNKDLWTTSRLTQLQIKNISF